MKYFRYWIDGSIYDAIDDAIRGDWNSDPPVIGIGAPGCIVRFDASADQTFFWIAACDIFSGEIERHGLDLVLPVDLPFGLPLIEAIIDQCSLKNRTRVFELHEIGLSCALQHGVFIDRLRGAGWGVEVYLRAGCIWE
ncbi:hypothetical protein [Rhodobacter capsulatus]|nr:hypothetical protein [Rhodobacter capsulatus]